MVSWRFLQHQSMHSATLSKLFILWPQTIKKRPHPMTQCLPMMAHLVILRKVNFFRNFGTLPFFTMNHQNHSLKWSVCTTTYLVWRFNINLYLEIHKQRKINSVIKELITAEKKRTGQGNGQYRLFEAILRYIKGEISTQVGFNMHIYLIINIDVIIRMCLLTLTKRKCVVLISYNTIAIIHCRY